MNRRSLLATVGIVTTGVAGCFGTSNTDTINNSDGATDPSSNGVTDPDSSSDAKWMHEIVAGDLEVSHGRLFGDEEVPEDRDTGKVDGGIFALDVETGDPQWTYGSDDGPSALSYTVAENGIYAINRDDEANTPDPITALGYDGTDRWQTSGGFAGANGEQAYIYTGDRAVDPGFAAFDAVTGKELWRKEYDGSLRFDSTVGPPFETGYVIGEAITVFDTDDGAVRWTYGTGGGEFWPATVSNGVVYAEALGTQENGDETIVAVADGDVLWSKDLPDATVQGAAAGTVLVQDFAFEDRQPVYAFDATTGTEQWSLEDIQPLSLGVKIHGETMFVAEENRITAYRIADGTKQWQTDTVVDGRSIEVLNEGDDSEYMIFIIN